jgi:hypothetical protein
LLPLRHSIENEKKMRKTRWIIYIALLVLIGIYVVFFNKHDPSSNLNLTKEERNILTLAAEQNSTEALHRLYEYYRFSLRDENKTISFLKNYIYLHNPFVDYALANHLFLQGNHKNYKTATDLLIKSANFGYRDSQLLLVKLYRYGNYVEKNISMSEFWSNKARLTNLMSPQESRK